jgi:hypothetical protein
MTASRLVRPLLILAAASLMTASTASAIGPLSFYSVTPCRIVDTRNATGLTGGPALAPFQTRSFPIKGACGIPSDAKAAILNVTVAAPTDGGYLTLWPNDGSPMPVVSTLNWSPGDNALANGAIVPLGAGSLDLTVFHGGAGSVHLILDVTGYFKLSP